MADMIRWSPWRMLGLLLILLVAAAGTPGPVRAREDAPVAGLQVDEVDDSVQLQWSADRVQAATEMGELMPFGGVMLAVSTVVVEPLAGAAAIELGALRTSPWQGSLTPAPALVPAALDWTGDPLLPQPDRPLPTTPVFELYSGMQRGRPWTVLGFSPVIRDPDTGDLLWVEQMEATVAGAQIAVEANAEAVPDDAALFAPVAALADAPGPTNALAGRTAVRVYVDRVGIQQITAAELAAAGLSGPKTAKLRAFFRGAEIALQVQDANGNGVFDGSDRLRLYAAAPGDRWNREDVYWLVADSADGLRMATRNAQPAGAETRTHAFERGRWSENRRYVPEMAGGDGDHWFHLDADTNPPSEAAPTLSLTAGLTHTLPLYTGPGAEANLLLRMTAVDGRFSSVNSCQVQQAQVAHRLAVQFGSYAHTDDGDDWLVDFATGCVQNLTRSFGPLPAADKLTVSLVQETERRRILFDAVDWQVPVQLDFGGKGATFVGADGTWRYSLSNTPADRVLYDVTDPTRPVILAVPSGANFVFQDGPAARSYVLAGEGTLMGPRVVAHAPVRFDSGAAHTIYIAPLDFHAALQPLVSLRRSQGYQVQLVDPQAIYAAWSYGAVDPKAIRSFLRYVVGRWNPAPIAAVMVGDATFDPKNYLGHGNLNVIPPYVADEVDPWIGETACENCYGQLDGDDPLAEAAFLVDIWIGRFPVADVAELQGVVDKLVRYETSQDSVGQWRRRSLQVADDYVKPNGELDPAGNFPAYAESTIAGLPVNMEAIRHYFSAATDLSRLAAEERTFIEGLAAWFVRDAAVAQARTLQYMNGGVGTVTYTGHANHWKYANLGAPGEDGPDKMMFGLWDVSNLTNRDTPFIMLAMTCLTSQFPIPAPFHFTLDEHLLLHKNGGAVAVFGPAGLSVATGHDQLLAGFNEKLWSSPRQKAKLGALTQAGYEQILKRSPCCIDINRTFLLLGDPLTPARVAPISVLTLPTISAGAAQ